MGGDQKRIKESYDCPESFKEILRGQVEDLQFIVNHLKTDVTCTLESNVKLLKMTVEREIGLLVYSLMEESLKERAQLKDHLNSLQKDNSVLIENEGSMMDELARLTLENEKLSTKSPLDERIVKELEELELTVYKCDDNVRILKAELDQSKKEQTSSSGRIVELEKEISDKSSEVENLRNLLNELQEKFNVNSVNLEDKENEIKGLEGVITGLKEDQQEKDVKINELTAMNCELMDLGEAGKVREENLVKSFKTFEVESEKEKEKLREELEGMKKSMTAQKIELEKCRETLNRERKLSALKISDLQEQLEEYKSKDCAEITDENVEMSNK